MGKAFERYVMPGLVIQAIMVGGGYATGRELVEFFLRQGPATALAGMAVTAALFSVGTMVSFELARRFAAFDYRTFTKVLLGPFWPLYELGYVSGLALVLSVVSSGAAELLLEAFGLDRTLTAILFMAVAGSLVFFGNAVIERVISAWSIIFYVSYGALFAAVCVLFGRDLLDNLAATPVDPAGAVFSGLTYTGYNISILPALIFVARNFQTQREAMTAGLLAGPLILLPGFAFLLSLTAFYPSVTDAPLPVSFVLDAVGSPVLAWTIKLVILGALIKTGAGMLHGLNERLARAAGERGGTLSGRTRSAVAIGVMVVSVYFAASVGLVDLIAYGYRFSGVFFLAIFVIPLLTRGVALIARRLPASAA